MDNLLFPKATRLWGQRSHSNSSFRGFRLLPEPRQTFRPWIEPHEDWRSDHEKVVWLRANVQTVQQTRLCYSQVRMWSGYLHIQSVWVGSLVYSPLVWWLAPSGGFRVGSLHVLPVPVWVSSFLSFRCTWMRSACTRARLFVSALALW